MKSIGSISYKSAEITGWKGALAFWGGFFAPWIIGWFSIFVWVLS